MATLYTGTRTDATQVEVNGTQMSATFYPGVIGNAQQSATGVSTNLSTSFRLYSASITGITKAASAVVEMSGGHAFAVGDVVDFSGISGMTQMNGLTGTVTARDSTHITVNINSTGFGTWTSGGLTWLHLFDSGDVGDTISINYAAGGGATLITTIAAYVSGHEVTLATAASNTDTALQFCWGNDDTAGIQAAVDSVAAAGYPGNGYNSLHLPVPRGAKAYMLTGTITVPSGVRIIGHNRSVFVAADSIYGFTLGNDGAGREKSIGLDGVRINLFTDSACGVDIVDCHDTYFANTYIEGNYSGGTGSARSNTAVRCRTALVDNLFTQIEHVRASHVTTGLELSGLNGQTTTVRVRGFDADGDVNAGVTNSIGVLLKDGAASGVTFEDCNFEWCSIAIKADNAAGYGCVGVVWDSIRFESNTLDIYLGSFDYAHRFVNCTGIDNRTISYATGFGRHVFQNCYDSSNRPLSNDVYGQWRAEIDQDQKAVRIVTPNANRQHVLQTQLASGGVVSAALGADGSIRSLSGNGRAFIGYTGANPNGVVAAGSGGICGRTDGSRSPNYNSPLWVKTGASGATVTAIAQHSAAVSGITLANPAVVSSTAHGFTSGETVYFHGLGGMTELEGDACVVTVIGANSYSIGVDTSAYTAWTSGGSAYATRVTAASWATYVTAAEPTILLEVTGILQDDATSGINGIPGTIISIDANTFSFPLDIYDMTAYSSGGTAWGSRGWAQVVPMLDYDTTYPTSGGTIVRFLLKDTLSTSGFYLGAGAFSAASGGAILAHGSAHASHPGDLVFCVDGGDGTGSWRWKADSRGDYSISDSATLTRAGLLTLLSSLSATGANFSGLTASRPTLTDASKNLESGQIDLATTNHVTGNLPTTNGGTGSNYANLAALANAILAAISSGTLATGFGGTGTSYANFAALVDGILGGINAGDIATILGFTPVALTSANIITALGYTPAQAGVATGAASAGTAHTHTQT